MGIMLILNIVSLLKYMELSCDINYFKKHPIKFILFKYFYLTIFILTGLFLMDFVIKHFLSAFAEFIVKMAGTPGPSNQGGTGGFSGDPSNSQGGPGGGGNNPHFPIRRHRKYEERKRDSRRSTMDKVKYRVPLDNNDIIYTRELVEHFNKIFPEHLNHVNTRGYSPQDLQTDEERMKFGFTPSPPSYFDLEKILQPNQRLLLIRALLEKRGTLDPSTQQYKATHRAAVHLMSKQRKFYMLQYQHDVKTWNFTERANVMLGFDFKHKNLE
jgi:hypothetical protein